MHPLARRDLGIDSVRQATFGGEAGVAGLLLGRLPEEVGAGGELGLGHDEAHLGAIFDLGAGVPRVRARLRPRLALRPGRPRAHGERGWRVVAPVDVVDVVENDRL